MDGAQVLEVVLLGQDEHHSIVTVPPARVNLDMMLDLWVSVSTSLHGIELASRFRKQKTTIGAKEYGRVCAFSIFLAKFGG